MRPVNPRALQVALLGRLPCRPERDDERWLQRAPGQAPLWPSSQRAAHHSISQGMWPRPLERL